MSTTTTILALGCDGSQGEAVLRGLRHHISRYDLPWLLTTEVPTHMLPHLLGSRQRFVGGQPRPDAIVGFIRHDLDPDLLRRHPLPVASCSAAKPPIPGLLQVRPDDAAIGRTAARFLLERGFRRLGFFGGGNVVRDRRFAAFAQGCGEAGLPCPRFDTHSAETTDIAERFADWVRRHGNGEALAVFCHQDADAAFVRRACHATGLRIPDAVAILGVDDDPGPCLGEEPTLSSVVVPWWQIGESLARCLQAALSGHPPAEPTLVPPMGVAGRASTDRLLVADRHVERAMRSIERRPGEPWNRERIAAEVGLSVRGLQQRWRRCGGTFNAFLIDTRLDRAEELLRSDQTTIGSIATRVGFGTRQAFYLAFRRRHGCGPDAWRRGPPPNGR